MSGVGSSVLCRLPSNIDAVLKACGDEADPIWEAEGMGRSSKRPTHARLKAALRAARLIALQADDNAVPVATRVAVTIGPASSSVPTLTQLLQAGMKIARLDFTYGDLDMHLQSWKNLQEAMRQSNTLCAVLLNPAGPGIHIINRPPGQAIQLLAGQQVTLTSDPTQAASSNLLPLNWPAGASFAQCGLGPGSSISVGQYLFSGAEATSVHLSVQTAEAGRVQCIVNNTCCLEGVHLAVKFDAGARLPLPCVGEADEKALAAWVAATAGLSAGDGNGGGSAAAEFIALPHTRGAADVTACRDVLKRVGLASTKVIAKLEDLEGLVAHSEILAAADAVIFSRGSLGTCMEAEKVFLAQKMLLYAANNQGKPVFVTRVVDSMTEAPRPTRAEATDVANLVLDGADGVLLGSETFRGNYPVQTVRTIAAICRAAEAVFDNYAFYRTLADAVLDPLNPGTTRLERADVLAASAVRAAHKVDAKLIVVFTVTGRTARLIAKYKPLQPILTVVCADASSATYNPLKHVGSTDSATGLVPSGNGAMKKVGSDTLLSLSHLRSWSHGAPAKRCLVFRGALPIMVDAPPGQNGADLLERVLEYAKAAGLVASGDRCVVSQCPRTMDSAVMSEAGVVQLITVDQPLC